MQGIGIENQVSTFNIGDGTTEYAGQSFQTPAGSPSVIYGVDCYITGNGSATGNLRVSIQGHLGTYGTSSTPDGNVIATATTSVAPIAARPAGGLGFPLTVVFSDPPTLPASTSFTVVLDNLDGARHSTNKINSA